jgi:hypothetical protein
MVSAIDSGSFAGNLDRVRQLIGLDGGQKGSGSGASQNMQQLLAVLTELLQKFMQTAGDVEGAQGQGSGGDGGSGGGAGASGDRDASKGSGNGAAGGRGASGASDASNGTVKSKGAGATGKAGEKQTRDGYTVNDVKKDILRMQAKDPSQGPPPKEPKLTQMAQGIVDGVNENFSGKNGIGDYSKVSGKEMAQTLTAVAWKESRFDTNGQDGGGVMQCAQCRLDDYNKEHGTNISQADLKDNIPLAIKTSTWAMANPKGIVGQQAGDVGIPKDLTDQAAYYWNYNPTANHGHGNELADYMTELDKNRANVGDA